MSDQYIQTLENCRQQKIALTHADEQSLRTNSMDFSKGDSGPTIQRPQSIQSTNAKSDDNSTVQLDDSFEDLGLDEYYLQFTELVQMGFVEITQEEINEVPEPVKLPKHEVNFELLVLAHKFDYRNDAKLNYMIEKAFITGLETEKTTREQAVLIRKNAYCLVFGISPVQLKNTWVTDYDVLIVKSQKRAQTHE